MRHNSLKSLIKILYVKIIIISLFTHNITVKTALRGSYIANDFRRQDYKILKYALTRTLT